MIEKTYTVEFSKLDLDVVNDMLVEFADKLRHYADAEMGWDDEQVKSFDDMYDRFSATAREAGHWWAQ